MRWIPWFSPQVNAINYQDILNDQSYLFSCPVSSVRWFLFFITLTFRQSLRGICFRFIRSCGELYALKILLWSESGRMDRLDHHIDLVRTILNWFQLAFRLSHMLENEGWGLDTSWRKVRKISSFSMWIRIVIKI